MSKKVTVKGIFGALFCVMAMLQLFGFFLLYLMHKIIRVPNIVLGLLYVVVAYFLLKEKHQS